MLRTAPRPQAPHHLGGDNATASSTRSSTQTNGTWVSSLTSYTASSGRGGDDPAQRGWPGQTKGGPGMPSNYDERDSRASSRRPSLGAARAGASATASSSKLPLSAYSTYNHGAASYNHHQPVLASPPAAYHHHDPYAAAPAPKSPSARAAHKLKPRLRRHGSSEAPPPAKIDLSKSMAENEGLGIFLNSTSSAIRHHPSHDPTGRSRAGTGGTGGTGGLGGAQHTRSSSGVSQLSSATAATSRAGSSAAYVHPLRPTPQAYTPPLARSRAGSNDAEDSDDDGAYDRGGYFARQGASPYAPVPALQRAPPPLHVRTHSAASGGAASASASARAAAGKGANASQTNLPPTPSSLRYANTTGDGTEPFPPLPAAAHAGASSMHTATALAGPPGGSSHGAASPDPPLPTTAATSVRTARSSLESAFRPSKRSRTNTNRSTARVDEDPHAAVQALRAEFAAREAAKDARWRAKAARRDESARRKARRRERERGRADVAAASSTAGAGVGGVGLPGPVLNAAVVDEEIEWMRKGKRVPKKNKQKKADEEQAAAAATVLVAGPSGGFSEKGGSAPGGRGRAPTTSRWSLFWFGVKSVFLRLRRGLGASG